MLLKPPLVFPLNCISWHRIFFGCEWPVLSLILSIHVTMFLFFFLGCQFCARVSFTGEEERRKKMKIFNFFKIRFLGFFKNQRTYLYSGGSGVSEDIGFRLSFHALSPLPIVLSKHFNHLHPYIEITTAISDKAWQRIETITLTV